VAIKSHFQVDLRVVVGPELVKMMVVESDDDGHGGVDGGGYVEEERMEK
jgi:hypothetical protein